MTSVKEALARGGLEALDEVFTMMEHKILYSGDIQEMEQNLDEYVNDGWHIITFQLSALTGNYVALLQREKMD